MACVFSRATTQAKLYSVLKIFFYIPSTNVYSLSNRKEYLTNLISLRKSGFLAPLFVFLGAVYLLATGAPLLSKTIGNNIPLGTPISWLGIIALPLTNLLCFRDFRKPATSFLKGLKMMLVLSIIVACFWGFMGYYFSGNWSNLFNENRRIGDAEASVYFWNSTFLMVGIPVLLLIFYGVYKIFSKQKV